MLKKFLKFILTVGVVFILGIFGYSLLLKEGKVDNLISLAEKIGGQEEKLPLPDGLMEQKFVWEYKGKQYSVTQELYRSYYDFYLNHTKSLEYFGKLPLDWEEKYYALFLKEAEGDETVERLTAAILSLGRQRGLTEDEQVELMVAFVQAIPYDEKRAELILADPKSQQPRYPYEVLFLKEGVCSGKSFLLVSMLRQAGYGAALLEYESENHMAAGVSCPKEYSVLNSGYCYVETTSIGHKIGIIPFLDPGSNQAVSRGKYYSSLDNSQGNLKEPGEVKIFQETSGKTYKGVVTTVASLDEMKNLEKEMESLKAELSSKKKLVEKEGDELDDLGDKMDKYKKAGEIEKYNALVSKYNDLAKKLRNDLDYYNSKVNYYNQKAEQYNKLVTDF